MGYELASASGARGSNIHLKGEYSEKDPKDRSKWMPKKVMLAKYADDAWREFVGWHKPCWLRSDLRRAYGSSGSVVRYSEQSDGCVSLINRKCAAAPFLHASCRKERNALFDMSERQRRSETSPQGELALG